MCRRLAHLLLGALVFARREATIKKAQSKRGKLIADTLIRVLTACSSLFEAEHLQMPDLPQQEDSNFQVKLGKLCI